MQHITTQIKQPIKNTSDEHILVVKKSHLFPHGAWQGLQKVDFNHYLHIIDHKKEFHPRSLMENDPTYKQIIPYLIFQYKDTFFLMQRQAKPTEKRLAHKLTLGIGGHIRQEDMTDKSVLSWAMREFNEEISYNGTFVAEPVGIINDDFTDVGKVHSGLVFLFTGNSDTIAVKSELKSGSLVTLDECIKNKENMETWSQIVLDYLVQK